VKGPGLHAMSPMAMHRILHGRAEKTPDRLAFAFYDERGETAADYADLNRRARAIARALADRGLFQERAILFFPSGLDYIAAFFGCLAAGVIAVPAYPPRANQERDRNLQRIFAIIGDAKPRVAITTAAIMEKMKPLASQLPQFQALEWLAADRVAAEGDAPADGDIEPRAHGDRVAFLQYTSGSTAAPKGVIVTHENLIVNERMITRGFETDDRSVCVGWLPLFHDMGLIGNILNPIYAGYPCHLMSPTAFLQRPLRWLEMISARSGTVSGGPNFAYDLCALRATEEDKARLDLSSWAVAFNGAEPVRADTLKRFARAFASCGFREDAFFPCYGLAEATLFVSGGPRTAGPVYGRFDAEALERHRVAPGESKSSRALVSSGRSAVDQDILILDAENGEPLSGDRVGEIAVLGENVAHGYWNREEETAAAFFRHERDGVARRGLRTGDLGFLRDGELFVAGRLKDLIIIRGRNHYPHDIELTAASAHRALRPGGGAAFSVDVDGEERLVLAQEIRRSALRAPDFETWAAAIRQAVADIHELQLYAIVFLKPGALPKTSSGKTQRRACRKAWLAGNLPMLAQSALDGGAVAAGALWEEQPDRDTLLALAPDERRQVLTAWLRYKAAALLNVSPSALDAQPLAALGVDSLMAVELQRLFEALGAPLPMEEFLEGGAVADLAEAALVHIEAAPEEPLTRAPAEPGGAPLSYNQRALWFLHRLDPDSAAYTLPVAFRVRAPVDESALRAALNGLVQRHAALRSLVREGDDGPRLVPAEPKPMPFEWVDAAGADDAKLAALMADRVQPLDPTREMARACYFQTGAESGAFLLTVHHLACDMTSLLLLMWEFFARYAAACAGKPLRLPEPALIYSDFARWQREWLNQERGSALWQYWQRQMADAPAALEMPTDRPRPPVQTFRGGAVTFSIGPETAGMLHELGRESGATLYMTLLAAWQALLARYSGQDQIVVGSPAAARSRPEFTELVGCVMNSVALRGDLRGNPAFRELLTRVRGVVLGALKHADYPFELLVEKLHPARDLSRSPLFQTMFALQKPPLLAEAAPFILGEPDAAVSLEVGGLTIEPFRPERRTAQFDLTLAAVETGAGLSLMLEYNADLFERKTAERLVANYARLLEAAVENPEARLWDLPLMAAPERALLEEWNRTEREYPADLRVHELIERQSAAAPERTALLCGDEELSYAELNARANRLARELRNLGVNGETAVGICLERGANLPVALLAVWKAGGAYVPLDPDYPVGRIAFALADSGGALLLTQQSLRARLPETEARLLLVDEARPTAVDDDTPAETPGDPGQLAYVIYTSGSTGRPKGVQVAHRSIVNFLHAMAREPGLKETDRLLAVTTVSFDIAGLELYLPLIRGASVVLATRSETIDANALIALMRRHAVTVMQATPATWKMLLAAGWNEPKIRVWCGGEALPAILARDLAPCALEIWNLYGPTETTIWSAARRVTGRGAPASGVEAIGRPIDNTSIIMLDRAGRPTPLGAPGELAIGGVGLARGYANRPDLTAERFRPDPFSPEAGARLYLTGDLARWLADSRIEFLGRLDFQVKLRGFRIELGEIEAAIARHPRAAEAVALVREGRDSDKRLVAFVRPADEVADEDAFQRELRAFLVDKLPDYMIPNAIALRASFPLTPNGKIDRKALAAVAVGPSQKAAAVPPQSDLERGIAQIWKAALDIPEVNLHDNFFDLGGHSLLLTQVNARLRQEMGLELTMVEMFQYPTVASLAAHVAGGEEQVREDRAAKRRAAGTRGDVAIIAVACRFPGAPDVESFWRNLADGVESLSHFSEDELRAAGVDPELLANPNYVKTGAMAPHAETFDAAFFDLSPRETVIMDPQHRVFLEIAWEALERAGCDPDRYPGAIGVYAGAGMNTYLQNNLLAGGGFGDTAGDYQLMYSSDKDFLATRVSYKLNLRGPSMSVQTACSTSLVAVHQACQSLIRGECDMALAGGVTIRAPQKAGYLYQEGMILSPDGHCRAFDAQAGGTVSSSGAGVVLLKRLDEAMADGDDVVAVIKGTALNNDAADKVGYTAPGVNGQAAAIAEAHSVAGVAAESIGYVECHGTGTRLGDPIEIAALTKAFATEKKQYCRIGSVKTNIGHTDAAAGVAGLIKAALALKHRRIPPSLHFKRPNPEIAFESTPFQVNAELSDWSERGAPRRAGVSSFGIGGTNAHAVLEEAPVVPAGEPAHRDRFALTLSARSEAALEAQTDALAKWLEQHPEADLADVAYTLHVGRKAFERRRALVCRDAREAADALAGRDPQRLLSRTHADGARPVAFMFSGQGSQYAGMTRRIYQTEPVFRESLDRCAEILKNHLGEDLRPLLYPKSEAADAAAERLRQTAFTQPALFAVEYALAQLLSSWGLEPEAMIGHSVGEYVAACLAGVFSLEDGLALIAARGRMIQELPAGDMLAVALAEAEVAKLLEAHDALALAAVNGPANCVVSGPADAIAAFEEQARGQGAAVRRLHTSHAFHSRMMDPILEAFAQRVSQAALQPPRRRYLSNVTGGWITAEQATDPDYWVRHLRGTVRFAEGVMQLCAEPKRALVEVGPGNTLTTLATRQGARKPEQLVIAMTPHAGESDADDAERLTTALAKLWLAGVAVDWAGYHGRERRRRLTLPTYAFQRQRFWAEPGKRAGQRAGVLDEAAAVKRPNVADWFYTPAWRRAAAPRAEIPKSASWLIFADDGGLGDALAERVRAADGQAALVRPGEGFTRRGEDEYALGAKPEDYAALWQVLESANRAPRYIAHLWGLDRPEGDPLEQKWVDRALDRGFFSLLNLAQALSAADENHETALLFAAEGLCAVAGEREIDPAKAAALGAARTMPLELPKVVCRALDPGDARGAAALDMAVAELCAEHEAALAAYRRGRRWVPTFEPEPVSAVDKPRRLVREGVYLITGGLGGVGLTLARELARDFQARLILTTRRPLPPESEWDAVLAGPAGEPGDASRVRALRELAEVGAEVETVVADPADRDAMRAGLARARQRFGPIHGALHAAGAPGGGLLQSRAREAAEAVMAPKIRGALVLAELLREDAPAFVMLFSSINAVVGGVGQADYIAANLFLDALAARLGDSATYWISVNWDSWREVGMAQAALDELTGAPTAPAAPLAGLPLFDRKEAAEDGAAYFTHFRVDRHWMLNEHWIMGKPIVPGTTYLEMARAAFADWSGTSAIEIRDAAFLAPLIVEPGQTRETRTRLEKKDGHCEFVVASNLGQAGWLEHARGVIAALEAERPEGQDPAALAAACDAESVDELFDQDRIGAFHLKRETAATAEGENAACVELAVIFDEAETLSIGLGPRWRGVRWAKLGGDQNGLALLELPENARAEDGGYGLHPALLDMAVGFLRLFHDQASFLPLAYKRLRLYAPLPARIYSHVRAAGGPNQAAAPSFDIQLLDVGGALLADIEGFSLGRIEAAKLSAPRNQAAERAREAAKLWLTPAEGAAVFRRLAESDLEQAVVSTHDLTRRIAEEGRRRGEALAELAGPREKHPRPELMNPYAPPRNDLEKKIAAIWEDVLGLEQAGVHDVFAELGGDSLMVTRVHARMRDELQADLSVAELMQYPTIAELAAFLDKKTKPKQGGGDALSQVAQRADKQKQSMRKAMAMQKRKRQKTRRIR